MYRVARSKPARRRRTHEVFLLANLALESACAHPAPPPRSAREPAHSPAPSERRATTPQPPVLPTLLPISSLPELDLAARFGDYLARDAVWVTGLPLAVNRDFDFATAISMDIGPGIAGKKRKDDNLALAQGLATVELPAPDALLQALCDPPPATACQQLTGQRVRIYGLLFGQRNARLQVVVEVDAPGGLALHTAVSAARPVDSFLGPGVLRDELLTGVASLAATLSAQDPLSPSGKHGRCHVGDTAYVEGEVLEKRERRALLRPRDPSLITAMTCPEDALVPQRR